MNDASRWSALEEVFHAALALDQGEREEYLRRACAQDEELRKRVHSLLASDGTAGLELEPWRAAPGPSIGPYKIISKLGGGGMGEVYLGIDNRLGRRVAVKVLPPHYADDPERRRRFAKEARAASALNHPNIAAVYDFSSDGELDYLAMEYVDGKPLDRLIPRDGLKLNEALGYAVPIADALACAHAAGVIHRDLKPANVVITKDGTAKVVDFGVAKVLAEPGPSTQTSTGGIVGTVAYMSPEQISGLAVDARSDIFSYGVMLYEMTTGRHPFGRDSTAATVAAILNHDPRPVDTLGVDVPPAVAGIIARCLHKDREKRFASALELKAALTVVRAPDGVARHKAPASRKALLWIGWAALLAIAAAATFYFLRTFANGGHELPAAWTAVPLTTYPFWETSPTFSPDSSQVAFVWQGPHGDNRDIYAKVVGEDEPVRLSKDPLPDDAPAWSPDGRWIAFLRHQRDKLMLEQAPEDRSAVILIPATGGPERTIATIYSPAAILPRISWDPSSTWLAVVDRRSPADSQAIHLLSVHDGEKRRITSPPANTVGDDDPSFSPDGRSIAFSRATADDARDIYILRLRRDFAPAGEPEQMTFNELWTVSPAWTPDGRSLVYESGTWHNPRLWRTWVPRQGERPGPAQLLVFSGFDARTPTISRQGRLAYTSMQKDADIQRLELAGPPEAPRGSGRPRTAISSTRLDHTPQYSPDGSRVAFASDRTGNHEIWVSDRDGSNALQLTSFRGPYTADPFWSPDGRWILFGSRPKHGKAAYRVSASGGAPTRLTGTEWEAGPAGWSRDGSWMYLEARRANDQGAEFRIWKMAPNGSALEPVTQGAGLGRAIESPDRRFLYYMRGGAALGSVWRMPLPSGEPEKILPAVFGLNFDVTNEGVFFIANERRPSIQFLRLADRNVLTVSELENPMVAYGMSLAPDHRSLLFSVFIDHPIDLMMVEKFR